MNRPERKWSIYNPHPTPSRREMVQRDQIDIRAAVREMRPEPIADRALAQRVLQCLAGDQNLSVRQVARDLGISRMELMSIVRALQYDGSVQLFD